MGGAAAVLRAALAAALTATAPASSRGALACLRSCADSLAYPPDARAHFDEVAAVWLEHLGAEDGYCAWPTLPG